MVECGGHGGRGWRRGSHRNRRGACCEGGARGAKPGGCVLGRRSSPEVPRKSRAARSEVLGNGVWELECEAACQMAVVHAVRTEPEVRSQEDASWDGVRRRRYRGGPGQRGPGVLGGGVWSGGQQAKLLKQSVVSEVQERHRGSA